jgi:hypothetical protein
LGADAPDISPRTKQALSVAPPAARLAGMTDTDRQREMIDELRRTRERRQPKSNQNLRYLRYSNAVSTRRWITNLLASEREMP